MAILASATAMKQSLWNPLLDRKKRDIDPHSNDLHCIDVSTYEDVVWDSVPRDKCTATFPKKVITKQERVCEEVTTLQCNVIGYTECQMEMEGLSYKSYEMKEHYFGRKKCHEETITEYHTKKKSECKDVTKQNCVTKWEIKPNGEKVWSGNEDCEPVTWNECKLVEYKVPFKTPTIVCVDAEKIPWNDCVDIFKTQMTSKMTCKPKSAVECSPISSRLCTTVQWQESYQEVVPKCETGYISKPRQEVSHKKKCLLPDTHTSLPSSPLQPLKPKEELKQNVFPGVGQRSGRDFDDGKPSPVFTPEE